MLVILEKSLLVGQLDYDLEGKLGLCCYFFIDVLALSVLSLHSQKIVMGQVIVSGEVNLKAIQADEYGNKMIILGKICISILTLYIISFMEGCCSYRSVLFDSVSHDCSRKKMVEVFFAGGVI